MRFLTILFFNLFILKTYSQEIPPLDSLTLLNGLKIYLLPYGEGSHLNVKLFINGGKKNESECQVGYSDVIRELLEETLKEKQRLLLKRENKISCETSRGQTLLKLTCKSPDLNSELALLSSAVLRLSFFHTKIHRAVSLVVDTYVPENLSSENLAELYGHLILYGTKNPLGRTYCQYQVQKVLPEEIRKFYFDNYTAKGSSLLITGNFNPHEVKKIIAKHFARWKPGHKDKREADTDLKIPKIKNKTIAFVNKRDSKDCLLKWFQSAPSCNSTDYPAFLIACNLFNHYLADKTEENKKLSADTLHFNPLCYTSDFTELNGITAHGELLKTIKILDTSLQLFSTLKFTEDEIKESIENLKDKFRKIKKLESVSSFYDPMLYNFDTRRNYLSNLSRVTNPDLEGIRKKYFNPEAYKLVIVGKEQALGKQLDSLKNVSRCQVSGFETCEESCIVLSKKKWKKGRSSCCFKCFMRGWCPCMYSQARLQ